MRSMSIGVTVCVRAPGTSGSRVFGDAPQRGFCMAAAGTVVDGKLERGKEAVKDVRKRGTDGRVRGFEEIPHTGRNGWINLVKFWRENRFQQLHKHMERTFNALGPIYRYREAYVKCHVLFSSSWMYLCGHTDLSVHV